MRGALYALLLLSVFAVVGLLTAHLVMARAAGAERPEVRLAAETAGLFAGGAAATVVLIALAWGRRRR
jgi:hypothetical protein